MQTENILKLQVCLDRNMHYINIFLFYFILFYFILFYLFYSKSVL